MDVVMLAQHGIPEAVATLGTATTREHLALLFKSTSKVVFCFDGDRAGRSAAWRALEQALPEVYEGRECQFMFLPDGHDPDSLVQEIGQEAFRRLIDSAQPLSQFLLGELSKQVQLSSMDGRAKLASLARPHLEKLREGPLRALMLDELGRLTRLARVDLEAMLTNRPTSASQQSVGETLRSERPAAPPSNASPIRRAMQALLDQPRLADEVSHLELLAQADVPGVDVLVEAIDFFHSHPEAKAAHLLEYWRDTPKGRGVERLLSLPPEASYEEGGVEREFRATLSRLTDRALRARVHELVAAGQLRSLTEAEAREMYALTQQLANRSPA